MSVFLFATLAQAISMSDSDETLFHLPAPGSATQLPPPADFNRDRACPLTQDSASLLSPIFYLSTAAARQLISLF